MLDFYGDIGDVADCLDAFSQADYLQSRVPYSYDVIIIMQP
jgi:hypothetical protein